METRVTRQERKKKRNKAQVCHLCCVLILETELLLEWSARCCLSVTFLASAGLSSLCRGELLGLCPYPLLIVHPVLTGRHKTGRFKRSLVVEQACLMMQWEGARTSRSCMPLPVLGLGCWAHSAAPGYPAGSETTISHPPVSEEVVNKGLLMNRMSG